MLIQRLVKSYMYILTVYSDSVGNCGDVILSGLLEEMRNALSSPILDSPNSSADITLDTTGELTVEDVKDFLMWASLFRRSGPLVKCVLGSSQYLALLGPWMKLRITTGTSAKKMEDILESSSSEAGRQTAGGEEHLKLQQICEGLRRLDRIYRHVCTDEKINPYCVWKLFKVCNCAGS